MAMNCSASREGAEAAPVYQRREALRRAVKQRVAAQEPARKEYVMRRTASYGVRRVARDELSLHPALPQPAAGSSQQPRPRFRRKAGQERRCYVAAQTPSAAQEARTADAPTLYAAFRGEREDRWRRRTPPVLPGLPPSSASRHIPVVSRAAIAPCTREENIGRRS
jgi:hypothetical protein